MTTTLKEAMSAFGREYLRERGHKVADDAEVSVNEEFFQDGACETCYSEYYKVEITDGIVSEWYWGTLYELIREMI